MVIINYWQQVSKHYLLSHLLLGVITAAFGFSVNAQALPTQNTGQTVNIITIASFAKANLNESSQTVVKQKQDRFLSAARSLSPVEQAHYSTQFLSLLPPSHLSWYSLANAIRAGPSFTA